MGLEFRFDNVSNLNPGPIKRAKLRTEPGQYQWPLQTNPKKEESNALALSTHNLELEAGCFPLPAAHHPRAQTKRARRAISVHGMRLSGQSSKGAEMQEFLERPPQRLANGKRSCMR